MVFGRKNKEDKKSEFISELENGFNVSLTVKFPEQIEKTGTAGKVVATAAFGLIGLAATLGTKNKKITDKKGVLTLVDEGFKVELPSFNYETILFWENILYKKGITIYLKDDCVVSLGILKNASFRQKVIEELIETHR